MYIVEGASHTAVLWVFHGSIAGSELHYLNNIKNCIWDPLVILCMDANGSITWHWPPSHIHVVNWLFDCLDSLVMQASTQIGVTVQVWFGRSWLWLDLCLLLTSTAAWLVLVSHDCLEPIYPFWVFKPFLDEPGWSLMTNSSRMLHSAPPGMGKAH